jgi:mannose-6-phosphate isomerase-like protein (cupin superfamily)
MELKDQTIHLGKGEMVVVPRGKVYKLFAQVVLTVLLVEPRRVVNTSETARGLTAHNDAWI